MAGIDVLAEKLGSPGRVMANHHNVNAQGLQILGRVQQGLSLTHRTGLLGEIDSVRAESAGSQGKAVARARAVLEKQIHHHLAA